MHNKKTKTSTMKRNIILSIACIALIIVGYSCKKDYAQRVAETTSNDLTNYAFMKVIDATVGANRNYVYQESTLYPITGSPLTTGSAFPATGTPAYFSLYKGNRIIMVKDTLSTTTQKPITYTGNLTAGNYYTMFTYDTTTNAKYVLVQDMIEAPADSTARVRFANLIYSSTTIPTVDVYSARLGTNIFTNVSVGQVTNFIPYPTQISDTLYIRPTGTTTNLASYPSIPAISGSAAFVPVAGRSYTVVFEGRYQTAPIPGGSVSSNTLSATNPVRSVIIYTNK